MKNNLKKILPLLIFKSKDDFYYLQILKRKKENPELGSNSRVIKNYYIRSKEQLENYYEEIVTLCEIFNARASIRLNKRSFKKVAFKNMVNVANTMSNGEFQFVRKSYDRACGLGHNDDKKTWILDLDGDITPSKLNAIKSLLFIEQPEGEKIIAEIPSKDGLHLIVKPFDCRQFNVVFNEIDIHKDNPTNLYIP